MELEDFINYIDGGRFAKQVRVNHCSKTNEITATIDQEHLFNFCVWLKDECKVSFEQLIDITAVDYLDYGVGEWETRTSTASGFSRGVNKDASTALDVESRFAVVYHLLSLTCNVRLRVKSFLSEDNLVAPSVLPIWPVANWYEREVFDLFGILFSGHHDLRRILTDYGFIGHPFRKYFPLSGHVEVRYDNAQERVIYEPVSIEPRTLVPKTIRSEDEEQVGRE